MIVTEMTRAQRERLDIVREECAELIHMASKAARHGYDSSHSAYGNASNQELVEREAGHVLAIIELMCNRFDLSTSNVLKWKSWKLRAFIENPKGYFHYLHEDDPNKGT